MSDDYDVGYGKPPKASQFKPGNNAARGRGKAKPPTLSMSEIIERALSTRKTVRRGDQRVVMFTGEILVERLIGMATSGTPKEMIKLMELIERYAPKLLQQQQQTLAVTYHRAEGSQVELPSPELWKKDV
jgi:hypothetical protein